MSWESAGARRVAGDGQEPRGDVVLGRSRAAAPRRRGADPGCRKRRGATRRGAQDAGGRTGRRGRGVGPGGYRSPEEWLAQKTGTSYGAAAGTLNASDKLTELPTLADAVRGGDLSQQ